MENVSRSANGYSNQEKFHFMWISLDQSMQIRDYINLFFVCEMWWGKKKELYEAIFTIWPCHFLIRHIILFCTPMHLPIISPFSTHTGLFERKFNKHALLRSPA